MAIYFRTASKDDEIAYIKKAVKKLKAYDDAYYNTDTPLADDAAYDEYREKIQKRVKAFKKVHKEELSFAIKYFDGVRAKVRESKRTAELPIKLGSLKKTKNDNDSGMTNFIKRALKASHEVAEEFSRKKQPKLKAHYSSLVSFLISPKLDGLTFVLHYKRGQLHAAYSGGDGVLGQEKMAHAEALVAQGKIPSKLSDSKLGNYTEYKNIYIVGEVVCSKKKFAAILKAQKDSKYNESRNAASGWVNATEPAEILTNAIDFVAYEMKTDHGDIGCELEITDIHVGASVHANKNATIALLKALKFTTYFGSPLFQVVSDSSYSDGLRKMLDAGLLLVKEQDYQLDGVVIEVSDAKIRKYMGSDRHGTPYFAVAYKVSADSAIESGEGERTTVTDIVWNTSKVGALKPTLIYKPIKIGNSTFTQATGNNFSYLLDKGIGVGTKISVVKAGDVIPKAYFADKVKATKDAIKPSKCSCGAKAIRPDDGKGGKLPDYYCAKGIRCTVAKKQQLLAAIKTTKVAGLGGKNVEKLYDAGYHDLFSLMATAQHPKKQKALMEIPGFGKSMLVTLSEGLPDKLSKMSLPDLMVMSCVFTRPGLSLAAASFKAAEDLIKKGHNKGKIKESECMEAVGKAKGSLLYANFPTWLEYYEELKSVVFC